MELEVWLDDVEVGRLLHDGASGLFALHYRGAWSGGARSYPLAPTLPLDRPEGQTDEQHSIQVRQFFENLLPEGEALDHAAAASVVSKANLAGLLAALGRETSGALRILLPGGGDPRFPQQRPLPRTELSERIRNRSQEPFSVWDGSVRLSIAGYQDKIAVYVDGDDWFLVDGPQMASTHIVKPAPARPELADLPFNEFFCMRLARRVGLDVAHVDLHHVPEPVLFVERFDRKRLEDGRVRRLHLIDGCQALGLPVSWKYERAYGDRPEVQQWRDGASMPKLFGLLQHSPRMLLDRMAMTRWVIFQLLIGNSDAHGKNVSFHVDHAGLRLAPAYDIVCMPPLGFDHPQAMAIGDAFSEPEVTPFEWACFAKQCGVAPRQLAQDLRRLTETLTAEAPKLARELADVVPPRVSDAIIDVLASTCARQRRLAGEIPKVKPEDL